MYDCIGEPDAGDGAMATLRSGGAFVSIRGVASASVNARDDVSQVRQLSPQTLPERVAWSCLWGMASNAEAARRERSKQGGLAL